jgi:hypothetical protein
MSRENVELVLESIRRFRPGGLDEWAELWHQDTRMTIAEGWPEPGPLSVWMWSSGSSSM